MSGDADDLCAYHLDIDDYGGVVCELPRGHAGKHRAEWETERRDTCHVHHDGEHVWGDWSPIVKPEPVKVAESPLSRAYANLLATAFPPVPGRWTKEPENRRECTRCGATEADGEWEPSRSNIYYVYQPLEFGKPK